MKNRSNYYILPLEPADAADADAVGEVVEVQGNQEIAKEYHKQVEQFEWIENQVRLDSLRVEVDRVCISHVASAVLQIADGKIVDLEEETGVKYSAPLDRMMEPVAAAALDQEAEVEHSQKLPAERSP